MPEPRWFKINNQIIPRFMFIIFTTRTCMWCPQCQQESLEYGNAYIQQIEILHYIDCSRKKMIWIWTLLCKSWLYFTLHYIPPTTLWSNMCYIILLELKIFLEINQFLTNLMWFHKYIMKYNRIWETDKLQLASSYTWQLMRLIRHFYWNVTINHLLSVCNNFWLRIQCGFWSNDEAEICC